MSQVFKSTELTADWIAANPGSTEMISEPDLLKKLLDISKLTPLYDLKRILPHLDLTFRASLHQNSPNPFGRL